ncbi:MAG: SMP-30/gluconolactonase/LRE family protein [Hyphomicrobiaceae bacterium]|nr:SMP-30/gluconolactonase/LRE family protein [Hyphomicrobiaceae bacterium]MCC0023475.1 SMP-30/gluconolactonase/LRE family protein [Hyphomicrobiaceae bacterium]
MPNDMAELFIDSQNSLGEGPLWHPGRQQLFWFAIHDGELFAASTQGEIEGNWSFGEPAAAAGIIDDNALAVATASGLYRLDLASGAKSLIVSIEENDPLTRTNDSRVGPGGGFWIGTMARSEKTPSGSVYHFRHGKLTRIKSGIYIPNATSFSPDGTIAYFADTPDGLILKCPIDPQTAMPTGDFTLFRDTRGEPGHPDGAVVDSEGYVWNARYGGGSVIRYTPAGEIDRIIEVPVPNTTCPAFGGPDLKTLYITTAHQQMSDADRARFPLSGSVFKIELDIAGQAEIPVAL